MADDTPAPASGAPPIDYNAIIQQIMQGSGPVTGPAAPATPAVNPNLPITSLLGEAFGGGVSPLYPMSEAQQTQAGNAALLNFGIGMLQNASGPVRHSLGQAVASGLLGAQGSLAGVREGQAQMLDVQNKQQQMNLERLKVALPLLMRQQAAGMPNPLLGGGGAPGGGIGATGAPIGGSTYEGALATHEGTAPNPNSSAAGGGQFLAGTWQDFAAANPDLFKGMSPEQVLAARNNTALTTKAITWLAQQNAPILAKGGAPVNGTSLGIAHYVGAGPAASIMTAPDNAPVSSFVGAAAVKANPELATMTVGQMKARYANVPNPGFLAPAGGTKTATAPPAATPAPTPVARPTAAPAAPAGTIQGTPDTGGTQVGGPGALPGVIRPPGPLVPGDVKTMIGGMTGAGASPTTLAPGGGTAAPTAPTIAQGGPPTVTPPAQPTPQVTTQGDQPPAPTGPLTIEQYRALHPSVINPSTYTVTPPNLDELRKSQAAAAQQLDMARKGLGGDPNKSLSDYNTATQAITKAQQDAQSKSLELQQAAQKNADDLTLQGYNAEMTRQQEARLKAQELAQTAAENDKQRAAAIALKTQEGQQAIQLEQAKGSTASETKVMDALNETHETARGAIDQLQLARSLSASAGDPTFWQGIQQSHPSLVRWLANIGSLSDDQVTQLGQSGAMDAALQKLVTMARAGSGFQRVTNMDLQLLQSQAPTGTDPQQWRDAKLGYLQSYMERQMRYVDAVRTLRADGTPLYQAQTQADKAVGDVVPQMPSFTDQPGNSGADQRHRWAADNVQPGTFFRAPDGKRMLIYQGQ